MTNGINWKFVKITFSKPIETELVLEFDFLNLNPKNIDDLEKLYLFTKEGWLKDSLAGYHAQKQALSRFFLGALVLSDDIVDQIRRELRKISPDVKIDSEQIQNVLTFEVIKHDVLEGEKYEQAKRTITKVLNKVAKSKRINLLDKIEERVSPTDQKNEEKT